MTSSPAPDLDELEPCDHHGDGPCSVHGAFPWNLGCPVVAVAELREAAAESGRLREARDEIAALAYRFNPFTHLTGHPETSTFEVPHARDVVLAILDRLLATPPAPSDQGALPTRDDLADTLCYIHWHDGHPEERHCAPSMNEAERILTALSALNETRLAAPSVPPEETRP